jgi:hypothetical protein
MLLMMHANSKLGASQFLFLPKKKRIVVLSIRIEFESMLEDVVQSFFSIQWTQNHKNVFLTLQQKLSTEEELVDHERLIYTLECSDSSLCEQNLYDTICIQQVGKNSYFLRLYKPFKFYKNTVKPLKGLEIIISKIEEGENWPRLTYNDVKYHFIQNDWSKWTEWSDEMESDNLPEKAALPEEYCSLVTLPDGRTVHVPFFHVLGENSNSVLKITTNDCRNIPVDTIPPLPDILSQELKSSLLSFWNDSLTVAQRLHTFTAFWNSTSFEERQVYNYIIYSRL